MHNKILRRYTLALYGVAEETKKLDEVYKDANFIIGMLNSNRDLFLFFHSPIINKKKKLAVVKEIFGDSVSAISLNFINLLVERHRDSLIKDVYQDYLDLRNEKLGIVNVTVKTAVDLDDKEKKKMQEKIENFLKLKSNPVFKKDESLIGGFRIAYEDTILDASIQTQLEKLKKQFKTGDVVLN